MEEKKAVLENELKYYMENAGELLKKYRNKYIVIKNDRVLGIYNTFDDAVRTTSKTEALGSFLVQHCIDDKNSTIQTFHSRVYCV